MVGKTWSTWEEPTDKDGAPELPVWEKGGDSQREIRATAWCPRVLAQSSLRQVREAELLTPRQRIKDSCPLHAKEDTQVLKGYTSRVGWGRHPTAVQQTNEQTRKLDVYTSDISIQRQLEQEDPKFEFQASLGYVRLISNKTFKL